MNQNSTKKSFSKSLKPFLMMYMMSNMFNSSNQNQLMPFLNSINSLKGRKLSKKLSKEILLKK